MYVTEHRGVVDGVPVAWRQAAAEPGGAPPPILYVHGVPTASWDWLPFLERTGGIAPDLPGFGASGRPRDFDYSIQGYDAFLEAFTEQTGLRDGLTIVVHDWGAVGLAFAQRFPERIARLVILSCLPFLRGYRWHKVARIWRMPIAGELFMAGTTRQGVKDLTTVARAAPGPMPDEWLDRVMDGVDAGMKRAVLALYRSAPEPHLVTAGRHLGSLTCPALVLWPDRDPYLPQRFGPAYADALGGDATYEPVAAAGHWFWLEQPWVVDRVAGFVT